MPDERVQRALATIAVNYAKRWMEGSVYDRAFRTPAGRRIRDLSPETRYAIEAALNISSAILIRHSSNDSALVQALKELGSDVAPELAKRLINGRRPSMGPHEDLLAGLSSDDLEAVRRWATRATAEERQAVIEQLSGFPMTDLVGATHRAQLHGSSRPSPLEAGTKLLRTLRSRVQNLRGTLTDRTNQKESES